MDKVEVQVRYGCGPNAGALVENYDVSLRTGAVSEVNTKQRIANPAGEAVARTLLKKAAARILSPEEARCLALEAAKSLPDWGGPHRNVSVEQTTPLATRFRARLRTDENPPIVAERSFSIDRATAHVHDDATGMGVASVGLAALVSQMLTLRHPLLLTEMDALEVARQIPEVQAQASKPCSRFSVGGPLSWDAIYVGVQSHCDGGAKVSILTVAVDPNTGLVTDLTTQKSLSSTAAERVARERLAERERERASAREALESSCRKQ